VNSSATNILKDPFIQPVILNYNNRFFIQIVFDQVSHETTEHIHITYHILCNKVNIGLLKFLLVYSWNLLIILWS